MAAVLLAALLPLPPFLSETVVLPTASSASSSSFGRNVDIQFGLPVKKTFIGGKKVVETKWFADGFISGLCLFSFSSALRKSETAGSLPPPPQTHSVSRILLGSIKLAGM